MNEQPTPADRRQADLLSDYADTLAHDPAAPPPAGLDEAPAATLQRLVLRLGSEEIAAERAEQIRRRLEQAARRPEKHPGVRRWRVRLPLPITFGLPLRLGLAALLVLTLIAGYAALGTPQPVGAQAILERAQATAISPASSGIRSIVMTVHQISYAHTLADGREFRGQQSDATLWYQAPNKIRIDSTLTQEQTPARHVVMVSDGTTEWTYDAHDQIVTIAEPSGSIWGTQATTLDEVLQQQAACHHPQLLPDETVAGRASYVIDLGMSTCSSLGGQPVTDRYTIWVDKATFLMLKMVTTSSTGTPLSTSETTKIQYNTPVEASRFTFTPPAGAIVEDKRPGPPPGGAEFQQQLAQVAQRFDFPIFAPRSVPDGLVPRKLDLRALPFQITYVPAAEVNAPTLAITQSLALRQFRAVYDRVIMLTEDATPVTVGGKPGWVRNQGARAATIYVLRDGTFIELTALNLTLSRDDLLQIAADLSLVPGSHAPVPNPTPPTLAQVRQSVAFPVFVPAHVPAGMTAEPPYRTTDIAGQPEDRVVLTYHRSDGGQALTIINASVAFGPTCCLLTPQSRTDGEVVTLPNGIQARFVQSDPRYPPRLWWEQDGTFISINSPILSKDEVLAIAGLLTKTGDIGTTKLVTRPTPTPIPPARFTPLRPAWLPEPMTVSEQPSPGTPDLGSGIVLSYAPHGSTIPTLTLRELPAALFRSESSMNPSQPVSHEVIGERAVTILLHQTLTSQDPQTIGCRSFAWTDQGLGFELSNGYTPDGKLRYSCDELRQVVASIH